ncbi:MAG: accessory gene regulator B family protein [Bacilli bacterium]
MKQKFLNFTTSSIIEKYPNLSSIELEEIRYGLSCFYLSITKLILIFIFAYLFGIFKEMIFMLFCFNLIRFSAHGLHASNSWICFTSSATIFLIFPIIAKMIVIPYFIRIILGIIAITLTYFYSPADTKKKPLIYAKKRKKLKIITLITTSILVLIVYLNVLSSTLSNLIIFGMYIAIILTLPITYKLFNFENNNYKKYNYQFTK